MPRSTTTRRRRRPWSSRARLCGASARRWGGWPSGCVASVPAELRGEPSRGGSNLGEPWWREAGGRRGEACPSLKSDSRSSSTDSRSVCSCRDGASWAVEARGERGHHLAFDLCHRCRSAGLRPCSFASYTRSSHAPPATAAPHAAATTRPRRSPPPARPPVSTPQPHHEWPWSLRKVHSDLFIQPCDWVSCALGLRLTLAASLSQVAANHGSHPDQRQTAFRRPCKSSQQLQNDLLIFLAAVDPNLAAPSAV